MRGLAMCQMQSMDILLQKISLKSKSIRKKEKMMNRKLIKKGIVLDKKRCYLEPYLKNALEGEVLAQSVRKSLPSKRSSPKMQSLAEEKEEKNTFS